MSCFLFRTALDARQPHVESLQRKLVFPEEVVEVDVFVAQGLKLFTPWDPHSCCRINYDTMLECWLWL